MTSEEWQKLEKKLSQLRALARLSPEESTSADESRKNEARNAALSLCILLDRHELRIAPQIPPIDTSTSTPPGFYYHEAATKMRVDVDDLLSRMAKARAKRRESQAAGAGSSVGASVPKPSSSRQEESLPARAEIAAERIRQGVVVLDSRYRGECKVCKKAYPRGERIYWKRGVGEWHPDCWVKSVFQASGASGDRVGKSTKEEVKAPPSSRAHPPPKAADDVEDDDPDDFDGLHSVWGGSPMKGKRP